MSSGITTWPQEGPAVRPSTVWVLQKAASQAAPVTSSGIPDAPTDGQIYGRQNLNWTPLTPDNLGLVGPTQEFVLPPPFVPPSNIIYWRLLLGGNLLQVGGSINFGSPFGNGVAVATLPLPNLPTQSVFNYGICVALTGSQAVQYAMVFLDPTGTLYVYNPSGLAQQLYLNNFFDLTQ